MVKLTFLDMLWAARLAEAYRIQANRIGQSCGDKQSISVAENILKRGDLFFSGAIDGFLSLDEYVELVKYRLHYISPFTIGRD